MSENQRSSHDPLEEAIEAFQQMTVPDRPSDAEMLAQLASPEGAAPRPVSIHFPSKRRYLMRLVVPSAAAALLVLGGLVWFVLNSTSSVALADVVKAAEKHKLVRYRQKQTTDTKEAVGAELSSTVFADLKALRVRTESRVTDGKGEVVLLDISDSPHDRHLMTNSREKSAWLGRIGAKNSKSFLENLRELQQKKGVTSVKDKLDGHETVKYRLEEGNKTVSLWVDAKTELPVRLELEYIGPTPGGNPDITRNNWVHTDFEWDPPLPKGFKTLDELFSTTPPKGYELDDHTNDQSP